MPKSRRRKSTARKRHPTQSLTIARASSPERVTLSDPVGIGEVAALMVWIANDHCEWCALGGVGRDHCGAVTGPRKAAVGPVRLDIGDVFEG
jgi:hypothetical protein